MYAVVETGGKQYRVSVGDKLKVEKLDLAAGSSLQLDKVLMINNEGKLSLGAPHVAGGAVEATVLEQGRGDKIRIVKFKRRKKYRRLQGHRQSYTELEITAIAQAGGETDAHNAPAETVVAQIAESSQAPAKKADVDGKASGDDLTAINGIGPVIASKLQAMGIVSFAQIAAFTAEKITAIDDELNFKGRIEREKWVEQAQDLA